MMSQLVDEHSLQMKRLSDLHSTEVPINVLTGASGIIGLWLPGCG